MSYPAIMVPVVQYTVPYPIKFNIIQIGADDIAKFVQFHNV
jgi:hypothetical protein